MSSTGLLLFDALCTAANAVDTLRERYPPASDAWYALTGFVQTLDAMIDGLVDAPAIEDDDDAT